MRDGAPDEVLAGACTWQPTVTSWLGGRMLAERVPISSGRVTADADSDILETLSISVPRHAAAMPGGDVRDWRPSSTDHPLARYGQILDVSLTVTSVITGDVWETRIGRYQIKDWSDDDSGTITIKGESLLARPRDDKLKVLSSPTGTLASEARRLLPAGMGASFDPALRDRAVPGAMSWAKDRLKNLKEIAAAWPALLRIDPWGQVVFRAPLSAIPVPVLTLRDGRGGTLISAPRSDSRAGAYNEVVASTSSSEAADVQGVASLTAGAMSVNGDYGVVTKEWSSPLIENKQQAEASANTMLSNSTRPALAIPARIAPDPRIELDDPVAVLRGASGHMETVPATFSNWVETGRNHSVTPRPTVWATSGWGAAALFRSIPEPGWVGGTFNAADTPYIFVAPSARAYVGGEKVTMSVRYRVTAPNSGAAQWAIVTPHARVGNTYWFGGAQVVRPIVVGQDEDVVIQWTVPTGIVANSLDIAIGLTNGPTGASLSAANTGFAMRATRSQIEDGWTSGAFFDGDSAPTGELSRTRWDGPAGAAASVKEQRTLLVPEHRVWVMETAEESVDVDRQWGWVTAYDLPLTVSDGDMRVDVGLPS